MPAYIIADVSWTEPDAARKYGELAYPTLVAAGGKILAATSQAEALEGDWRPNLLVLIEFPSAGAARRWLDSAEYRPAREVRCQAASTSIILVEDT